MKKILLFSFTAFVIILSGCSSNNNNSDPKTVLNHFFDALAKKDVTEAKKYVTKDSEGMMGMVEMGMKNIADSGGQMEMYKKENMMMGDPVINGERATIPVKDKRSGEETDFVLKKENGDWKVAFDKSTLMEMAQKKMKEHGLNGMNGMGMDSSRLDSVNMDSIQNKLNNLTPEEKAEANKMIDSAQNILEKMQKKVK
jgi:hypothetical protein